MIERGFYVVFWGCVALFVLLIAYNIAGILANVIEAMP